jgi:hypothetical protein
VRRSMDGVVIVALPWRAILPQGGDV